MNIYRALAFLIIWVMVSPYEIAVAKVEGRILKSSVPGFVLNNGDRIVFLGNSLFENELEFGYIEFALSTRWKDLDITFRNLGLSGDTVFGEARGYFTNPPSPYELFISQIRDTRPTVVFLAYGANESEAGEKGLPSFQRGLNQLLDSIEGMGAKAILLSPIPLLSTAAPEKTLIRNKSLELYASAINRTASERDLLFVDIFNPLYEIQKQYYLSDDGVHLNEMGYFQLASVIENGLGLTTRNWSINLDLAENIIQANTQAEILESDVKNGEIKFAVTEDMLPLPFQFEGRDFNTGARKIQIIGLRRGYYMLSVDGVHIIAASAKTWADGVFINRGTSIEEATHLLGLIIKKNELFFNLYRPPNRTYILGFRSYEQGRHIKGLEELAIIIKWLEGQINISRSPKSNIYQLTAVI